MYVYDHSARTYQVALLRVTSPSFVAYHLAISSYFLIDKGPNLRSRLDKKTQPKFADVHGIAPRTVVFSAYPKITIYTE